MATDCSMGRPDAALLPFQLIKQALSSTLEQATHEDLQYSGPEPLPCFAARVLPRLRADSVRVSEQNLMVGSSAQQFLMLALEVITRVSGGSPVVAVEDPGYATLMDSYERAGVQLAGVAIDHLGAVPEALEAALAAGANAAVFTPRGHNPTGCSWSPQRAAELADVLAAHRDVMIIEDDQFSGVSTTCPGSLLSDQRIADRVLYIRSFSKSIGPDVRVAVAAAESRLRNLIMEAKSFADGWTSRLLQKAIAEVLADGELDHVLDHARDTYRARRESAAQTLNGCLFSVGGSTWCGPDGVNLWVHLSPGVDADNVIEHAAEAGVLVAPGEPFFILPGQSNWVRFNPCTIPVEKTVEVAQTLAKAIVRSVRNTAVSVHV
jgi:GntR family transcriptional regulator/MocR family aminotransferase